MSNTFEKTQSQYERKLARQKQLDMMEAAASGQAYDGSSPSDSIHSHHSSSVASSIGGIHASSTVPNVYGVAPEGAIESARRFLWDEDEEDTAHKATNPGYGGGADQQHHQFLGEKQSPGSSAGAMMNRMFGGFRGGQDRGTTADENLAPRRTSMWMSDAAPRSQEAEEYIDPKAANGGRNPVSSFCYALLDCLLAVFHTLVGALAILCESIAGCIASCNPRLAMYILGGLAGFGVFVFGITAVVHRTKNVKRSAPPVAPKTSPIENPERFAALRESILESKFSSGPQLDTEGTAQYLALRWLTDEDPAKLEIDDDSILQRYALAVFYFSTYVASEMSADLNGGFNPAWKYMDYWMSDKGICLWYGVSCPAHIHEGLEETHYNQNSDVLKLNLTDNNVVGTIPSELRALENLESLDLGSNKLKGTIPKALFGLRDLKELYLEENELEGTIPIQVGKVRNMRDLFLGTNKLEGTIPTELASLTNLRALGLDENFLTGKIPNIWNLNKLLILYLDSNELTGSIPRDIKKLTDMLDFRVRKNNLNGTIPDTIHDMTHLELFYVDDNELTGTIPELWDLMLRVQEIQLYKNKLTGALPDSIHELRDLKVLYADNNMLEGTIPSSYGALGDLHTFYAFNNKLHGTIPTELGNMEDLRDFQIYNNRFEGSIPSELGNCYKLQKLEVQANKLTGNVPSEIGALENLSMLKLYRNYMVGSIPPEICRATSDFSLGYVAADCNVDLGGKLECPCCKACYP